MKPEQVFAMRDTEAFKDGGINLGLTQNPNGIILEEAEQVTVPLPVDWGFQVSDTNILAVTSTPGSGQEPGELVIQPGTAGGLASVVVHEPATPANPANRQVLEYRFIVGLDSTTPAMLPDGNLILPESFAFGTLTGTVGGRHAIIVAGQRSIDTTANVWHIGNRGLSTELRMLPAHNLASLLRDQSREVSGLDYDQIPLASGTSNSEGFLDAKLHNDTLYALFDAADFFNGYRRDVILTYNAINGGRFVGAREVDAPRSGRRDLATTSTHLYVWTAANLTWQAYTHNATGAVVRDGTADFALAQADYLHPTDDDGADAWEFVERGGQNLAIALYAFDDVDPGPNYARVRVFEFTPGGGLATRRQDLEIYMNVGINVNGAYPPLAPRGIASTSTRLYILTDGSSEGGANGANCTAYHLPFPDET